MFTLTVYRGDRLVQELELDAPEVNIGRKPDNAVVLPDDGKGVSRIHASIRVENGEYVLYDGNSRNGTYVDGKPIKRIVIQPGQDFVVGPYRLILGAGDTTGSTPTIVASRDTPPPMPVRESTSRGAASEGSTKSRAPAISKLPSSKGPSAPMPVAYIAAAAVVLLALAGALIWMMLPQSAPEEPQIAAVSSTTSVPETTTSIPEAPPPDPYTEQITLATTALDGVETTLTTKQFPQAAREIDRILKDHIAPILAVDAQHPQALELETRAKNRLAEVRKIIADSRPAAPPPPVINPGPTDVQPKPGESPQDWKRRTAEVQQDYALAKKYFNDGDNLGALKLFADLAGREPGYLDVSAYVKNAQERLDKDRLEAVNNALRLEGAGHKSYLARNLPQAATELTQARAAFERAAVLQAPGVEKHIADNLERRQLVGKAALDRARTHANQRNRAEAQKWFELVIELLPSGDPVRSDAEADLRRLSPGLFDLSPIVQQTPRASSQLRSA